MREHAEKVEHDFSVLEIVGTGGDGAQSFNISTTAALVTAPQVSRLQSMETGLLRQNAVLRIVLKLWGLI